MQMDAEPKDLTTAKRLRRRAPLFFVVVGGAVAFVSAGAALGLWLSISSNSVETASSTIGQVAEYSGISVPVQESDSPFWMLVAFAACIALCAGGIFFAVVGGLWSMSRGARRVVATTSPVARTGARKSLDASKAGARGLAQISGRGVEMASRFKARDDRQELPESAPPVLSETTAQDPSDRFNDS